MEENKDKVDRRNEETAGAENKNEKKINIGKDKPAKGNKKEVIARGNNLHLSMKQGVYICRFIKKKNIDRAIEDLREVIKMKKAIPFKGEIPHRKGMMSGRYPVNAANIFIKSLKGLRGNSLVNGFDIDKTEIYYASVSWASRPARRGGVKAKRVNLILKAKELENIKHG